MDFRACLKRRLLVREKPSPLKAGQALKAAKQRLHEAAQCLRAGIDAGAVALAYTAMFHAARALLFHDGYREKSHVCVKAFIQERYVKTRRMEARYLSMLDSARLERHEVLYGLETTTSHQEALLTVKKARAFLAEATRLLRLRQRGSKAGVQGSRAGHFQEKT